jgi:hypothetical protein
MVASLAPVIEVQVVEDHIVGCAHLQLQVEGNVNVTQMAKQFWLIFQKLTMRCPVGCDRLGPSA